MSAKQSTSAPTSFDTLPLSAKHADFWIKNSLNVIFRGKHGVGKTALVKAAFERNGLRWKYFSASTLDPWVDFVGIPKEVKGENGETYLDLVRPREFAADEVEAIFIDEFNRGPKKVKNAVMELLQFKSINGKPFKNLKLIWAAINPEDDNSFSYDVEKMDPAQLDRFHIHIDMPYQPDLAYFSEKYGEELAESVCEWWNTQDAKVQNLISPRRLDYAVDIGMLAGSNLREVLPNAANVRELAARIEEGSCIGKLKRHLNDPEQLAALVNDENVFRTIASVLEANPELVEKVAPVLEPEKITMLLSKSDKILNAVQIAPKTAASVKRIFKDIRTAAINQSLISRMDGNDLLISIGRTDLDKYEWSKEATLENLESMFDTPVLATPVKSDPAAAKTATPDEAEVSFDKTTETFVTTSPAKRKQFLADLACKLHWDVPANRIIPLMVATIHSISQNFSAKTVSTADQEKLNGALRLYNYLLAQAERHQISMVSIDATHAEFIQRFGDIVVPLSRGLTKGGKKSVDVKKNIRGLLNNEDGGSILPDDQKA